MTLATRYAVVEDALDELERVQRDSRGAMTFWAGATGSGRGATFNALQSEVEQRGQVVVRGSFREGAEPPPPLRRKIIELYGTDIFITAASTIHPLAGVVAMLIAAVQPTREMVAAWRAHGAPTLAQDPFIFRQALLAAAQEKPVLCLLSHFDEAPAQWGTFFQTFAVELERLPIQLILTLDAPPVLTPPAPADPNSWHVAYYLCGQQRARWVAMPPLTEEDTADAIGPADESVVRHLFKITKGNPRWTESLWQEWQSGVVEQLGGKLWQPGPPIWYFTEDYRDKLFDPVNHILGERLAGLGRSERALRDILELGAIQGQWFAAPALFEALRLSHTERGFSPYEVDSDGLTDLIDDVLVADGLLQEEEPAPDHPEGVWRYRFASDLIWLTFDRHAVSALRRGRHALLLANALRKVYAANPQRVAPILARLYQEGGDKENAVHYRTIAEMPADHRARLAYLNLLDAEARALLASATWEHFEQHYAVRLTLQLLEGGGNLLAYRPSQSLYPFFVTAAQLAARTSDRGAEANAAYYCGICESNAGNYAAAYSLAAAANQYFRDINSPLAIARTSGLLGVILQRHGEYGRALPLYEEALSIRREALGGHHPSTATSLNDLADLYRTQGEYGRALPLLEEALAIDREVLGSRHPDTAKSLSNLAGIYEIQGEYGRALPLVEEALEIRREVLGNQHQSTANSLNDLALLYKGQGEYGRALPLYEEALAIKRHVLGNLHPDTANSLNNLALLYRAQGEYGRALPLYEEALAIYREVLGSRHPYAALSLNNLGYLYDQQGEYGRALPLYEEAVSIMEERLGRDHPDTKTATANRDRCRAALEQSQHPPAPDE